MPVDVFTSAAELSLWFLAKTLPFMVIGVIFAELIVALKIVDKIAFVARPITNFAHLRDECGASFLTAFASATSANAMLAAFYKDKIIEKKELFIASMMTAFPAIVTHWRPMLPVLIPLLGIVGIIYFGMLTVNTRGFDKDHAYNDRRQVPTVLSTIMVTVRWLIPYYLGIFGPRIGTEIMVLATRIRTGIMIVVIFALALFW